MSEEYVFPQDDPEKPNSHSRSGGLTKRELFAVLIYPTLDSNYGQARAAVAVAQADVLLEVLARPVRTP